MSLSAVRNDGWPNSEKLYAKRTTSYLMLFHGCHPSLVLVRLQHRHRRTRQVHLQVHLQVQHWSEVTKQHRWIGARQTPKTKTTKTRGMAIEIRMIGCEIFLNGWRSSQIIWRTLKRLHPHTFLRTQIRNVLRKWHQNEGSIVFILTSQNTEIAISAYEPKLQGLLAGDALAKQYFEQTSFWWIDNSWSQSPQWSRWITEQSSVRCRGTRSCHSMDPSLSVQNKKLLRIRKRVQESFSNRDRSQKLFTLTIHWNLAKIVKNYHGTIELRHLIRDKMVELKELYEEWKRVL